MKVLYIDPRVNSSASKSYHIYQGLYDEFSRISNCFLYSKNINNINEALNKCPFKPDILYFGLGWFAGSKTFFAKIDNLDKINIPIVCYIYKPQNHLKEKLRFCKMNKISLIVTSLPAYKDYEKRTGIRSERIFQSAKTSIFKDRKLSKIFDVGMSGALHNNKHYTKGAFKSVNLRATIQEALKKQKNIRAFLNCSDGIKPRIINYNEYANKVAQSKMWISTLAPFGEIPPRFFEIGMSKTLILTNPIPEPYKDLFKDGVNCVEFKDDMSNFLDKFYYYLNNWNESQRIIDYTYEDFHRNHTWKSRANRLLNLMEELI